MSNRRKVPLNFNFSTGQEPTCPGTSELENSRCVSVLHGTIPGVRQMLFLGCVTRNTSNFLLFCTLWTPKTASERTFPSNRTDRFSFFSPEILGKKTKQQNNHHTETWQGEKGRKQSKTNYFWYSKKRSILNTTATNLPVLPSPFSST